MIEQNFIKLFEDSFKANWDLNAFSNYGENHTLTYAQVAEEIAKLHILFEECGIKKDDKIALIGKNSINWAVTFLGTVSYGAIIVPILQDFNPNDIQNIINHSDSKLLFLNEPIWENLDKEEFKSLERAYSLTNFDHLYTKKESNSAKSEENLSKNITREHIEELFLKKYEGKFLPDNVNYVKKPNSEVVCISYTSGTTGFSKGVMLTGNNYAGNVTFGIQTELLKPGYQIVSFLPLAHAYGCAFDFLTAAATGSHVHFISRPPTAAILLPAFAKVKPNVIFCVPIIIEKIYKKQIQPKVSKPLVKILLHIPGIKHSILSKIKDKLINAFGGNFSQIVVGGAPLNPEVEDFFNKMKFPITVGYGMTECAPLISYAHTSEFVPKSAGKLLDIMEARIENPDPKTGIGEIVVKGENVMSGYYKNEEATNEVLSKDGWLRTGDLGTIDANKNIFIRGRNKTMLLSANGQNIYPEEIEAKLNNLPYVLESIVVDNNKKLEALVCPDYEMVEADGITQEQLEHQMNENLKHLNHSVAAYERISKIHIHKEEFEKTPKKSIKRYLYTKV
ncbi:MAG: long-chain fatty acid--CoA ligase [Porphyromonadaceae bacterium]|nr:long-chain fatty acid--CoA ligase [Porphyromonadaceae bacterium]